MEGGPQAGESQLPESREVSLSKEAHTRLKSLYPPEVQRKNISLRIEQSGVKGEIIWKLVVKGKV
jgi:hypothetical protein